MASHLDLEDPPAGQRSRLRALQLAILACFGGVLAEWLVVALGVRQLANIWELQWGSIWLLPTALAASAGIGILWGWWWRAWFEAGSPFEARLAHAAMLLAAVAGAYGISFGRHFEVLWRRALFVAVVALAVHLGLPPLRRWLRAARAQAPTWLALAACGTAVGLEVINRWVLVRLYPVFHLALALLSLGCLVCAALVAFGGERDRLAAPRPSTVRVWGVLGIACLGLIPWTSQRLARFDNFRWSLLENAPLLGRAVVLAGLVSPPIEPTPSPEVAGKEAKSTVPSAQLEGRDVLLITVDALRADHLGCYGYARPTTPNIDALASSGTRFAYAYCATPHTSYSLTSLMTGKYIRPLLLQGAGQDSDTWASLLRTYEYRTAAFYPPAVFFIDGDKFAGFEQTALGFEYEKKEFLEGEARVEQVRAYLSGQAAGQRLFVWVHLFGPHEPYELHPEAPFGDQDVDRYDSEIRAADETVGQLVRLFRQTRPNSVAIVTADHGEEFGDHGGRYHGTSVYEEQVRVPLVVNIGGTTASNVVAEPVQTIDLLPTVLSALNIPIRPRIRGRDLSAHLVPGHALEASAQPPETGLAYAETDEQTLLAEGPHRLICLRRVGACKLFDIHADPKQSHDLSAQEPALLEQLRGRLQAINAGHGQFENQGRRAEGKHWPTALLRGLAGDGDAAADVGDLLEDADVAVRREAARVLMRLRRQEAAAALRLAVQRDEDTAVRRYAAIALTRLGEGAPLTLELLQDNNVEFRRLAALALAEGGDDRGEAELIAWWGDPAQRDYAASRDLLQAFAKIRCKAAVRGLIGSLDDVRLRPDIAATLAKIGEEAAVGALVQRLRDEPYQTARVALSQALVDLGATQELVVPLRRWLGVPDPLKDGVQLATRAEIAEHLGGPSDEDLKRIRKHSDIGEVARIIIPKTGNGQGLRLLVRVRNRGGAPAAVRVATPLRSVATSVDGKRAASARVPELDPARQVRLEVPSGTDAQELWALVPPEFGWYPGLATHVVVYAPAGVEIDGLLVLPLQDEVRAPEAAHPAVMPGKADPPTTPGNPDANR